MLDTIKIIRNRKGAELSLNVIIVAIIVLVVLVVMIVIFSGKIGGFREGVEKQSEVFAADRCEIPGTGRKCLDGTVTCDPEDIIDGEFSDCESSAQGCCRRPR